VSGLLATTRRRPKADSKFRSLAPGPDPDVAVQHQDAVFRVALRAALKQATGINPFNLTAHTSRWVLKPDYDRNRVRRKLMGGIVILGHGDVKRITT
jgi:hypothetical protein